jgi:hypothetical protein
MWDIWNHFSKIPHTRHIKQPDHEKVLIVNDSINKKYGSNFKYPKYGALHYSGKQKGLQECQSSRESCSAVYTNFPRQFL